MKIDTFTYSPDMEWVSKAKWRKVWAQYQATHIKEGPPIIIFGSARLKALIENMGKGEDE